MSYGTVMCVRQLPGMPYVVYVNLLSVFVCKLAPPWLAALRLSNQRDILPSGEIPQSTMKYMYKVIDYFLRAVTAEGKTPKSDRLGVSWLLVVIHMVHVLSLNIDGYLDNCKFTRGAERVKPSRIASERKGLVYGCDR
ncbi:hypothetical protein EV127DRAFT_406915 [Xylaria flabelliformis]|nr:hypothetical protein EV127DRAFT_406915 [Xylaria flabelliformis]